MNEMWEALERYQPYAEQHGFGAEWVGIAIAQHFGVEK